ncbi:MAG: hypothetical protein ACI4PO_09175 [Faecousia sp.]
MKIKTLYHLPDYTRNLIETADGKLYTFIASPYRKLEKSDLSELQTHMPTSMAIKAAHATRPTASNMKFMSHMYGLEMA